MKGSAMLKRGFLSYAGGGAVAGAPAATRAIAVSAAAGGGVGSVGTVSASYGISIAVVGPLAVQSHVLRSYATHTDLQRTR